jgi:putative ABC transport system substrate-binding protein
MLALGILSAPLGNAAQAPAKLQRIGWLGTASPGPFDEAFRQGLRELGYVEGQNLAIEWRWVRGNFARLPALAAELAGLNVNIVVAGGTPAALATKKATTTIPIVMVAGIDPAEVGLVASLARPGGNVTGVTRIGPELVGKRLELLKESVPTVSRVAILWHDASNPNTASMLREARAAAGKLRLHLESLEVKARGDLEGAFAAMAQKGAGAFITVQDGFTLAHRTRIVDLAAKTRLPGMYETRDWTDAGGLLSYGASDFELYRRAAYYVDRILKGTRPADLPVEQPTRFELVVNLKTAKALGLTIPQSVLVRADRVIQ